VCWRAVLLDVVPNARFESAGLVGIVASYLTLDRNGRSDVW
jgi:hypothetical protein